MSEQAIRVAVITISDRSYAGTREDLGGPLLVAALNNHAQIVKTLLLPDEFEQIKTALVEFAETGEIDIIFTTGGTGFSPRDVTPEATLAACERLVPGIPEAMRQASLQITPRAMLSRAAAGIRKNTLIINLPGSPKAALENLEVFLPVMRHALEMMHGGSHGD